MKTPAQPLLAITLFLLLALTGCTQTSDQSSLSDGDMDSDNSDEIEDDIEMESDADSDADADFAEDEIEQEPFLIPDEYNKPFITDEEGGVLILHGANVDRGAKSSPYYSNITREQALRFSSDWGLNFVRLLILWAGVEPQPGVYDSEYLDMIEERLDWFHEADVHVFLDMHQDVYSEFTCGAGAPLWAVRDDGLDIDCPAQWFLGYFEPGVQRAFDNFWNYDGEHSDLQDHYADMWAAVATRFKDHPAVLAYDIMNEPHPGSDFDALEALGVESPDGPSPLFDRTKLQPFYQRVINRIREVDADTWIGFESRYGAPGNGMASYFTKLDDPRQGSPRLFYAPHLYSVAMENDQAYDPESDKTITKWENHRASEIAIMDVPLVAGEWGFHNEWPNADLFMSETLDMYDRLQAGWAYWSWDPGGWSWLNPDETEKDTTNLIVRTYPQRIAGIPKEFHFDTETRVFSMTFFDSANAEGATMIYIPAKRFYPDGWAVTVSDPAGSWSQQWNEEHEILSVTTPKNGTEHIIEIRPQIQSR
jgi:endoglycosylceramidase